MPDSVLAFLVLALVVGVIAIFLAIGHRNGQKQRARAHYVLEPDPTEERRATVLKKEDGMMQESSYSARGVPRIVSRRVLRVTFRLGSGQELTLDVGDEDVYRSIVVGEADLLVTRNGYFMGFGRHGATLLPESGEDEPLEPQAKTQKRKTWEAD